MKIHFIDMPDGFEAGVAALKDVLDIEISPLGMKTKLIHTNEKMIRIVKNGDGAEIYYSEKIHFFRALGILIQNAASETLDITEEVQFDTNGVMIDVSQSNSAPRPMALLSLMRRMALMGLDMLMLYMEDSYVIEGRPMFGYMRAKYTREQLKEIDQYGQLFGIEVIPAIQTLAHLREVLKWGAFGDMMDNDTILLAGDEKVYGFIKEMLSAINGCFTSKRIHIGMDEAWGLGGGMYQERFGYKEPRQIMNEHLARVNEIVKEFDLEPMLWSDMFFRGLGDSAGLMYGNDFYATANITEEIVKQTPDNTLMVFWEYNDLNEDYYVKAIENHRKYGRDPIFAGGIWNWMGFGVNYSLTFGATNAALSACKKTGLRQVFATLWGDDGTENLLSSNLLGLQLYAEHGYAKELDEEKLKKRFEFCTGGHYDDFLSLNYMDEIPGVEPGNGQMANPSKYILWQNVLYGLFDKNIEPYPIEQHYAALAKTLDAARARNGEYNEMFEVYYRLARVLEMKSVIGLQIEKAGREKDSEKLFSLCRTILPDLYLRIRELRAAHREFWYKHNFAAGWDVLDVRYGVIMNSVDTAIYRLDKIMRGEAEVLEEAFEIRVPYNEQPGFPAIYNYRKMPSASSLSQ